MSNAFSRLVSVSLDDFNCRVHGRQRLLSKELSRDAWGDIFSENAVDEIIANAGLRAPLVTLVREGQRLDVELYTRANADDFDSTSGYIDAVKVFRELSNGATIILRQVHRYWPAARRFANELTQELRHPVRIAAFITPPGAQGFQPHYDDHDVFVLQVKGEKEWYDFGRTFTDPLPEHAWMLLGDKTRRRIRDSAHILHRDILQEGDSLYVPRGYLHAAKSLDSTSIHLTIALLAITRHDVLKTMCKLTSAEPWFRAALPLGAEFDAEMLAGLAASAAKKLEEFVETRQSVDDLDWEVHSPTLNSLPLAELDVLRQARALRAVTMDDQEFVIRPHLRYRISTEDAKVILQLPDSRIELPTIYSTALRRALSGRTFTPKNLPEPMKDEQKIQLTESLIRVGAVVPCAELGH